MPSGLPGGSNIVTGVWCLEVTAHLVMSWDQVCVSGLLLSGFGKEPTVRVT